MTSELWPDLPELPPAPEAAICIKEFLVTINRKGRATRSDLLSIAGSSTALDSWLKDLIHVFGFVEEITSENGDRLYKKTPRGRIEEQVVTTYWPFVRVMLARYSRDRRAPRF